MENKSNYRSQRIIHETTTHEREIPQNNIHFQNEDTEKYTSLNPEPSIPSHDP